MVCIGWLARDAWQPYYYNWRCGQIAADLNDRYGLVVRYGDPAEFFVPPFGPLINVPEKGFSIERAKAHYAYSALIGVRKAIVKYPKKLIKEHLTAVFIAGVIKTYDVQIGGSYVHSWIYLSALKNYEQAGYNLYSLNFHHEFSSILINNDNFSRDRWQAINEPGFKYLPRQTDIVHSAAQENRRPPEEAPSWYQAGFVHDYGMSSLENDVNMYAELAMTDPSKLKALAQQYPKIKAKAQILVAFYGGLAPELETYFKSVGLMDDSSGK